MYLQRTNNQKYIIILDQIFEINIYILKYKKAYLLKDHKHSIELIDNITANCNQQKKIIFT